MDPSVGPTIIRHDERRLFLERRICMYDNTAIYDGEMLFKYRYVVQLCQESRVESWFCVDKKDISMAFRLRLYFQTRRCPD